MRRRTTELRRMYAMTINTKIKSIAQDMKYRAQTTWSRAKQKVGTATGNDRLRREGKAEQLRSRFIQFAKKIKGAVRP
jgi:uncharacterized protein YjbJ (UPF0337 family)